MMFDLNEKKFSGTVIFNNGIGGIVKDVEISVEKKKLEDPDTYPAYKLIVTDNAGGKINQGFYYPTPGQGKSDEENEKRAVREVGRIVQIAKAVVGSTYSFPQVSNAKEAFDVLFKIIKENIGNQKFNVYVNYGTTDYPSNYMGLRYFNFIENANVEKSTLRPTASDLLQRLEEDKNTSANMLSNSSSENWV